MSPPDRLGHEITDPNAPLGWQCGDPGCQEHGTAVFAAALPTEPALRTALERALAGHSHDYRPGCFCTDVEVALAREPTS